MENLLPTHDELVGQLREACDRAGFPLAMVITMILDPELRFRYPTERQAGLLHPIMDVWSSFLSKWLPREEGSKGMRLLPSLSKENRRDFDRFFAQVRQQIGSPRVSYLRVALLHSLACSELHRAEQQPTWIGSAGSTMFLSAYLMGWSRLVRLIAEPSAVEAPVQVERLTTKISLLSDEEYRGMLRACFAHRDVPLYRLKLAKSFLRQVHFSLEDLLARGMSPQMEVAPEPAVYAAFVEPLATGVFCIPIMLVSIAEKYISDEFRSTDLSDEDVEQFFSMFSATYGGVQAIARMMVSIMLLGTPLECAELHGDPDDTSVRQMCAFGAASFAASVLPLAMRPIVDSLHGMILQKPRRRNRNAVRH